MKYSIGDLLFRYDSADYFIIVDIKSEIYYIVKYYNQNCLGKYLIKQVELESGEYFSYSKDFNEQRISKIKHICTCSSLDLFRFGCKCGGK